MNGVYRREPRKRLIRRNFCQAEASEAIGKIEHGCEIFGVNKGKFSLVDIMAHCLEATGPADVVVSTWTAAGADMDFALRLLTDGRIRSIRFVVDFSFPTRQPAYCAALRERFGDAALRVTKTHAKFVTIRNGEWNLVIRSSMNLNENRRLESFEISDDPGMAQFLDDLVEEIFREQALGQGFTNRPYDNVLQFEELGEDGAASEADALSSTDTKKYFGDGRYDNDLRRVGAVRI